MNVIFVCIELLMFVVLAVHQESDPPPMMDVVVRECHQPHSAPTHQTRSQTALDGEFAFAGEVPELLKPYFTFGEWRNVQVSEDGRWISYPGFVPDIGVTLFDLWSFEETHIPWRDHWSFGDYRWFGPQQISLHSALSPNGYIVYNFITHQEISLDLNQFIQWGWGEERLELSPDTNRAMFGAFDEKNRDGYVGLLDVERNEFLWRDERMSLTIFSGTGGIDWSHGGQQVAFLHSLEGRNNTDLFILDRNGTKLRVVTDFSTLSDQYAIIGPEWSPDDRYIAFWLSLNPFTGPSIIDLYLYDVLHGKIIKLCSANDKMGHIVYWSPNSRSFAYQYLYDMDEPGLKGYGVVVFDLVTGNESTLSAKGQMLGRLNLRPQEKR